jgi:hypothetical protein
MSALSTPSAATLQSPAESSSSPEAATLQSPAPFYELEIKGGNTKNKTQYT